MRQLRRTATAHGSRKIRHQDPEQKIPQRRRSIAIPHLLLNQAPERIHQVIGDDVGPRFWLGIKIGGTVLQKARKKTKQNAGEIRLFGFCQNRDHFAVEISGVIAGGDPALEAVDAVLGLEEFGALFDMRSKLLRGQAEIFQQDRRVIGVEASAAQPDVQQPVAGRVRRRFGASMQTRRF